MAYKCSFLDNEVYGASDINRAFSAMTTAGVLPFTQSSTIAEDFNTAANAILIEGVGYFGESLLVHKTDNSHIIINNGNAIFSSGAMIFVDSEGVTLEFTQGEVNYVYIEHNQNLNYIAPQVSLTEPPENAIPLARILADGTLIDTRTFGTSRFRTNTANVSKSFSCNASWNGSAVCGSVDIGSNVFTRIIINGLQTQSACYSATTKNTCIMTDEETMQFGWGYDSGSFLYVNASKTGQTLTFSITGSYNYSDTYTISFEVI